MGISEKMLETRGSVCDEIIVDRGALNDIVYSCAEAVEAMEKAGLKWEAENLVLRVESRLGYPMHWRVYKPTLKDQLWCFMSRHFNLRWT